MKRNKLVTDAKAGGSAVARASFDRPGGTHGKSGKRANRNDRRSAKQRLRRGDYS
jgi:hypothetical protein